MIDFYWPDTTWERFVQDVGSEERARAILSYFSTVVDANGGGGVYHAKEVRSESDGDVGYALHIPGGGRIGAPFCTVDEWTRAFGPSDTLIDAAQIRASLHRFNGQLW